MKCGCVLVTDGKIAAHGTAVLCISTVSVGPEIVKLLSGDSGYRVRDGGHCEIKEGERHCSRNCVGDFLFYAQENLHWLKLGAQLDTFSRG